MGLTWRHPDHGSRRSWRGFDPSGEEVASVSFYDGTGKHLVRSYWRVWMWGGSYGLRGEYDTDDEAKAAAEEAWRTGEGRERPEERGSWSALPPGG